MHRNGNVKVIDFHPGGRLAPCWFFSCLGSYGSLISAVLFPVLVMSCVVFYGSPASAQSVGSAGTIEGSVTDPNNAAVVGAEATLDNSVTQFHRSTTTDETGTFRFDNIPQNNYTLTVSAKGFGTSQQVVNVRSSVPISLKIPLQLASVQTSVTITAGSEAIENVPSAHTDVAENLIERLPLTAPGSGLNELIAAASPNVVRDSNGFFHPLGDHAQTTYLIDGQPISDQRSKAFSTQLPVDVIQSLEIVTGAAPPWVGDKTSLVVNTTTKSGLGLTRPQGSFYSSYGSFGTIREEGTFGMGGPRVGNFIGFNFERSGRFLDAPEFSV